MYKNDRVVGWGFLTVTFLLVVLGCIFYVNESVGWAQFLWVLASGTAGVGFIFVLERK